ncbi:MAG: hypothetical protein R8G66_09025 [Cytophagales bacterium]|nr:hypothetical protein [Cytophagales bacterium]
MLKQIPIIALIVLMSCKGSEKGQQQDINPRDVIIEQLGNKFEKIDRGDLSLCFTVNKQTLTNRKTVLVINNKNAAIIYGPEKLNAKVSWHSDRKLLIQETPEVIQDKQSSNTTSYIFNLDTKEKESNTP